jgi:hypothetical protein
MNSKYQRVKHKKILKNNFIFQKKKNQKMNKMIKMIFKININNYFYHFSLHFSYRIWIKLELIKNKLINKQVLQIIKVKMIVILKIIKILLLKKIYLI